MLPALPTGRTWMSGASPSRSTISKDAVFWPSMRNGLTELTSATGYWSDRSRARVRQSSKLPWTWSSRAPWASACDILPSAILPSGTSTAQTMPARTAYAAADAEVLPVEAQMTAFAPSSAAFEIAMVMPRSLNEPVGLAPSTLSQTSQPVRSLTTFARTSGVPPSRRLITGVASVTGSRSRYSSISPRHCAHGVHGSQFFDRRREGRVGGDMGDDDESRVVAVALLTNVLDRHPVLGERRGDLGEHAGLVRDSQADVVTGPGLPDRLDRQVGVGRLTWSAVAGDAMARDGDDVAEHGAGGRRSPGS